MSDRAKKVLLIGTVAALILLSVVIVVLVGRGKDEEDDYREIRSEAVETTGLEESTQETRAKESSRAEEEESTEETEEALPLIEYTEEIEVDYDKLAAENADYKCWLNIPDTDVSYPVVMYTDNDYYLHRNFDGEYAYAGTLFIDSFSEKGVDQDNLIIYGHNMKNGTMFGSLKNFEDKDYFDSHRYIELHMKDETRVYEIFSVRDVSSDIDSLNFALDGFEFDEYVENAVKESLQKREVSGEGQILTLSTCVGDYTRRLLISGVRVR